VPKEVSMFSFKFNNPDYCDEKLNESLFDIVNKTSLLSMSTVCPSGDAHINVAYYAYDQYLNLYIITSPTTKHAINLLSNGSVAATVFDSHQKFWEDQMQGMQIFGICKKTSVMHVPRALKAFATRFPVFSSLISAPEDFAKKAVDVRLYSILPQKIKLFDEARFGEEVFIELQLN
jgi:uncharacterized protein YhbP (UPF0306 family)